MAHQPLTLDELIDDMAEMIDQLDHADRLVTAQRGEIDALVDELYQRACTEEALRARIGDLHVLAFGPPVPHPPPAAPAARAQHHPGAVMAAFADDTLRDLAAPPASTTSPPATPR